MANRIGAVLLALLVSGACSGSGPAATPTQEPGPAATPTQEPGYVSRALLGDDWPFTVEDGILECTGAGAVTFTTEGMTYAVNGLAMTGEYLDIDPIWAADPAGITPKKNIGPLIQRGLALCGL